MFYFLYTLRLILRFVLGVIAFVILYFLCSFWLPYLKVNQDYKLPVSGIAIYLESNGVHTDFVLPAKTEQMDWFTQFPCRHFQEVDTTYRFVAIGWGDRGFYLYTPTWSDLTFLTAFKAAFALDSAAMHVTYHPNTPRVDEWTQKLVLTPEQYQHLISYIIHGFKKRNGAYWHIDGHSYGMQDTFYEAEGCYSLFNTCNVWTGNGLKNAGVRVGIWTPFEDGIRKQL
jgi:uncharacterized protein (TIGR02117 family)